PRRTWRRRRLRQIDLAAVSQVFGESLEQDLKASGSLPQPSKDRFEDGPLLIGEIHAPECSKKKLPLDALIVHLNDAHHWTRERIAAWVADPDVPQDESY